MNVVTRQLLDDLEAALEWLETQQRLHVVVLRGGKKTGFLAGADLREFAAIASTTQASATSERGQKVFGRLAALPAPSVAVIHGPCLGGGLELALACDYRMVIDRPDTTLGLPEMELGLLPAWGGTVRLPRVIGLEPALQVILGGKRLSAREAKQAGLADALAHDEASLRKELELLLVRAVSQGKPPRHGLPILTWRQRFLESHFLGRRVIFQAAERKVRARTPDDMPAPLEALETVRVGLSEGPASGFAREREAAGRLALTPACRNLIGLFLQREVARKLPAEMGKPEPIRRVAVLGAGVMGAGIAQLAALSGCEVVVREINEAALNAGLDRIHALFDKLVQRGKASPQHAAQRRAAIHGTTKLDFRDVDLIIEAVVEDLAVKKQLFAELANRAGTILATNTSSLTLAALAEVPDPGRLAGLHFFNPVHKMPLVEIVRHPGTRPEVIARLMQFVLDLGKVPAVVSDGPGFVVNAILMPYLEESVLLTSEHMKISEIDRVMRRFGMPAGPLELLDQIGLDVAAHVARTLGTQGLAASLFSAMQQQGRLGEKTGRGFYQGGKPDAEVERLAASLGSPPAVPLPPAARLAEARERLVLRMVNEAVRLLDESRADANTIDLAMILGTGWAPHRGGPLRYADTRGPGEIRRVLESLAERHGERFAPVAGLVAERTFRGDLVPPG
jgi:3-hydroxyacyl-CoA dehydrogenase/enoyl-CoA hydratase/3-hydroxybutyryl-CoA epimerase